VSKPTRIFIYSSDREGLKSFDERRDESLEFVTEHQLTQAIARLHAESFDGVCLLDPSVSPTSFLLEAQGLLQKIPDGLALLDDQSRILWHNQQLKQFAANDQPLVGERFLDIFESAKFLGPDFGPFHTALGTGETARTVVHVGELMYLDLTATPLADADAEYPSHLLVMTRDVSSETVHKQKLDSIYRAGLELGDLQPSEVLDMTAEERAELLKEKILHYTQDVLEFETVEVRVVDRETNELVPLLEDGMDPEASDRTLQARAEGNGVTGFVAATGRSYLCEDTTKDPLYITGAPGARSSLTVPLILHDEVLGTFNVESPRAGQFSQADLQFLELFCREVSIALNTLNLLKVEHATTLAENAYQLLHDVSDPVDEILNAASWIREKFIGHDQPVADRLERILNYTREIRSMIQQSGERMNPRLVEAGLAGLSENAQLRGKNILLVDADKEVRHAAHDLLERYGCNVETAHDGTEALMMIRGFRYDIIIADIRLPDMSGSEFYRRVLAIDPDIPIILMTGFGYDSGHSLVKARQLGMKSVLYKPFRRDLLLKVLNENLPEATTGPATPPAPESGPWAVD